MKALLAAGTAALTLAAVFAGGPASAHSQPHFFTTKTPYAPQEGLGRYQDPPRGYRPIFTENVARHGSRAWMFDR